jgi:multidrug efflux pump subunit AcrA (membrane-fusion protein)
MSTKRTLFIFYILAAISLLSISGCNQGKPVSESDEETSVITPVTVTPVIYGPVTETIELPASTAFLNKSTVRSTTTGTVENISITIGDVVKKDQLICTVRTKESTALNNALKTDSTLSFSGKINIPAPKDGVISEVTHQNGDFVQEGDELVVISDQSSLVFILDTPFEYAKYVESSGRCKIKLRDNRIIEGSVSGKLPEMDPQSQTVKYIIRTAAPGQFPSNLFAIVSIIKNLKSEAEILPKDAVLGNETQTEFWVMKLINDSVAVKVDVKKGYENDEEVEILEPAFLKTDRIVLTGGYGLPDTAKILIKTGKDE